MKAACLALLMTLSGAAMADTEGIPISEQAFVDSMKTVKPLDIRNQFGEPEKITEIRDQETGQVFGSVWHYHDVNTAANGKFYKTTMLDVVDDTIVAVVFSDEFK
jgi:hypothetical protein